MAPGKIFIVSVAIIALLIIFIFVWLFSKERKNKKKYKIKYFDKCLELKKQQARTFTFVSARNAINSFHSMVSDSYAKSNDLKVWYVYTLGEAIIKASDFKSIFVIFSCFEKVKDDDLWEEIKKVHPEVVVAMTGVILKELTVLKTFSEQELATDEKDRLRVIAEQIFQFVRQGFLENKKGEGFEPLLRDLRKTFAGK